MTKSNSERRRKVVSFTVSQETFELIKKIKEKNKNCSLLIDCILQDNVKLFLKKYENISQ